MQIFFIFLALLSSASANDFDNWYFNALAQKGTTTSRYLDKDGNEMQTAKGIGSGKISDEGKVFEETGEEIRDKSEEKISFLVRWTKVDPKTYKGVLTDNKKNTSKITMKIKGPKLVEFRHITSYKYSVKGLGRLQKDGRIYFQSDAFHLDAPEQRFSVISWYTPDKK